jgi:putative flippase GtrA
MTLKISSVFHRLWQSKVFRFLVCGVITAVFNVLLLIVIIQAFEIKTPFFRNLANVLSIEVSLVFSFFVLGLLM